MSYNSGLTGERVVKGINHALREEQRKIIVHRAISPKAKAGDVYYFADGSIKFRKSFTKYSNFLSVIRSKFGSNNVQVTPSEEWNNRYYCKVYIGQPVLVKIKSHNTTFDADWFEVKELGAYELSAHTRSPHFEIESGHIICVKKLNRNDVNSIFIGGYYDFTTTQMSVYSKKPARRNVDNDGCQSICRKFRRCESGARVRYGLHKVYARKRRYRSVFFMEAYPNKL